MPVFSDVEFHPDDETSRREVSCRGLRERDEEMRAASPAAATEQAGFLCPCPLAE